jgi:hypothetical protein
LIGSALHTVGVSLLTTLKRDELREQAEAMRGDKSKVSIQDVIDRANGEQR